MRGRNALAVRIDRPLDFAVLTDRPGSAQLCSVWSDPDFDPERQAVYYLRAVENPSCRYSAWQCVGLAGFERPESQMERDSSRTRRGEAAWDV